MSLRDIRMLLIVIVLSSVAASPALAERYAVLVSAEAADQDDSALDCEFWYDLSATYQALLATGYAESNIHVFYGAATNFYSSSHWYYNFDHNIVDAVVTHDGVLAKLDQLAQTLQPNDELFFWWFGHGRDANGDVGLLITGGSEMLGSEIVSHLAPIPFCEIMINSCHSGCFLNNSALETLGFLSLTGSQCDEPINGTLLCDSFHMSFPFEIAAAFAGRYPGLQCGPVEADANQDGRISYAEALDRAVEIGLPANTPGVLGPVATSYLDVPGIVFGGLSFADDTTGNNNGRVDIGETVIAYPVVVNTSTMTITNVNLVLSVVGGANCAGITDGDVAIASVPAGQAVTSGSGFVLVTGDECDPGAKLDLLVSYTFDGALLARTGGASLYIGAHLPAAILDLDAYRAISDGAFNFQETTLIGDGDYVPGQSGAGAVWFQTSELYQYVEDYGVVTYFRPRIFKYDLETAQPIEDIEIGLQFGAPRFFLGYAVDDRNPAAVQHWTAVYDKVTARSQVYGSPNWDLRLSLSAAVTGLAFDRDNLHLWCMRENASSCELREYDVSNPGTPVLIQGPITVPWPLAETHGAGGLDYREADDMIIAANSQLGAVVVFKDLDPAQGGGVAYQGMIPISSYGTYGVAAGATSIAVSSQIDGHSQRVAIGISARPRTVTAYDADVDNEIVTGSIVCNARYENGGADYYWEFQWRTAEWTDSGLDLVTVDAVAGSPCPGGTFGEGLGNAVATVVPSPVGGFLHTVIVDREECFPACTYAVDVQSMSFGEKLEVLNRRFRVPYCIAQKGETAGDSDLTLPYLARPLSSPFHSITEMKFYLPEVMGGVTLTVYDIAGRVVKTLHDGSAPAGWTSVTWRADDANGRPVADGVYFARLHGAGIAQVQRFAVLR